MEWATLPHMVVSMPINPVGKKWPPWPKCPKCETGYLLLVGEYFDCHSCWYKILYAEHGFGGGRFKGA